MKLWPVSNNGVQKKWSDAEGDWCEQITRCHSCPLHTHTHTHTHRVTYIFGVTPIRSQCPAANQRKVRLWNMTEILTLG